MGASRDVLGAQKTGGEGCPPPVRSRFDSFVNRHYLLTLAVEGAGAGSGGGAGVEGAVGAAGAHDDPHGEQVVPHGEQVDWQLPQL